MRPALRCAAFLAVTVLAFASCKQGAGERCEVDRDCSSGLMCVVRGTEGVCGGPDQRADVGAPTTPDAGPAPLDAGSDDAAAPDASSDARQDAAAPVDAASVLDAPAADAVDGATDAIGG